MVFHALSLLLFYYAFSTIWPCRFLGSFLLSDNHYVIPLCQSSLCFHKKHLSGIAGLFFFAVHHLSYLSTFLKKYRDTRRRISAIFVGEGFDLWRSNDCSV